MYYEFLTRGGERFPRRIEHDVRPGDVIAEAGGDFVVTDAPARFERRAVGSSVHYTVKVLNVRAADEETK
jgi:hypothetical protein